MLPDEFTMTSPAMNPSLMPPVLTPRTRYVPDKSAIVNAGGVGGAGAGSSPPPPQARVKRMAKRRIEILTNRIAPPYPHPPLG